MCPVNGNCRNTPVEVFESKYPFLTLGYEMRKDSGGAGKYRGGPGSARRLRVLAPEITVSALLDRTRTQAWRLFGGLPGASGGLLVGRKGDAEFRTFSEAFGTMSNSKLTRIVLQGYVPLAAALGASPAGPPEFVQDAPAERKTRLPRDVGHWEKLCAVARDGDGLLQRVRTHPAKTDVDGRFRWSAQICFMFQKRRSPAGEMQGLCAIQLAKQNFFLFFG